MTKEGRTIALAISTIFVYALSIFLQKGAFIFPFPLNELIFLISALIIGGYQIKHDRVLTILFIVTAVFNLLSNEFYWAIFLNTENMVELSSSVLTDVFKLLFYSGIILSIVFSSLLHLKSKKYLLIFPVFGIVVSAYYHFAFLEIVTYLYLTIITFRQLSIHPIFNLWFLLFVLECTKLWSLMV